MKLETKTAQPSFTLSLSIDEARALYWAIDTSQTRIQTDHGFTVEQAFSVNQVGVEIEAAIEDAFDDIAEAIDY